MKFGWIIVAAALVLPTAGSADFSVSKPKPPAAHPTTTTPPAPRTPTRPRPARPARPAVPIVVRPPEPPAPTGIDPAFVNETLQAAGYKTTFTSKPAPGNTQIESTSGNSNWLISFKQCSENQRCGEMQFYTLWRVSNEANVCFGWHHSITNDPFGVEGKPTCFTLPTAGNQFHLILSTAQAPYASIGQLTGDRAKSRILAMLDVWNAYIVRLPEAYEYARMHCPRKNTPCLAIATEPTVQGARRLPDRALTGY